jgi:hyperpolarization activated cyclic nucleotide-gated potassium channel 1
MHHGAANKIPFFKGRDNVFISSIIPFLQHQLANKDELIYEEGEFADEMYFI